MSKERKFNEQVFAGRTISGAAIRLHAEGRL
jgi:hypothetical protein